MKRVLKDYSDSLHSEISNKSSKYCSYEVWYEVNDKIEFKIWNEVWWDCRLSIEDKIK